MFKPKFKSIKRKAISEKHKLTPKKATITDLQQDKIIAELEKELYKTIHFFLILSQVFLSAPAGVHQRAAEQINANNINNNKIWEYLLKFLHISWCAAVFVGYTICVYNEYTESNIDLPTVQKPLYFCEYIVYLIHIFHILISTNKGRRKYRDFLSTLIKFDQELMEYDIKPKYSLYKAFINSHLLLVFTHFVCTVIVDYFYTDGILVAFIRSTTVYMFPNIILHISLIQYYALLYGIIKRANDLNHILKVKLSKVEGRDLDPILLHENLHKVRKLYSNLELFNRNVNDAFAQSVVLIYVGSFMNLSVNIFLIYKYVHNFKMANIVWIMYSVVWTFMHVAKMFLILYYNQGIQNEKNSTALLLNDVKGQTPAMEETLTHFILQLIADTRTFVVCGVAELNMNFITSLLVAISTLFIFLLQYDITFEALTKTYNSGSPTRT